MSLQIEGKVVKILPIESGTGKTGNAWKKQSFVVEIGGQYPKQVCVTMWNDAVANMTEGDSVKVQFDLESREFNGKYYTEVKAWKVDVSNSEKPNLSKEPEFPDYNDGAPF